MKKICIILGIALFFSGTNMFAAAWATSTSVITQIPTDVQPNIVSWRDYDNNIKDKQLKILPAVGEDLSGTFCYNVNQGNLCALDLVQ